jgi:XTP/dITP diphosphohydrolase
VTLLIIATRNAHKVEEIRAVLGSDQWTFRTLQDFPQAPAVVEDASTFAGNATRKAVHLAAWLGQNPHLLAQVSAGTKPQEICTLADDSGLEVDASHGAPGVHSARFAALGSGSVDNSNDQANNAKLLRLLEGVPAEARTARFRCVIALTPVLAAAAADPASPVCSPQEAERRTEIFEGHCEGRISTAPRGHQGFGYDPLFVPLGFEESFAELGDAIKNQISHRAQALRKLRNWFNRRLTNRSSS